MNARRAFFVTGTDTGVGKTRVAVGLLHAARAAGRTTAGLKPVAAGAEGEPPANADALALQAAATVCLDYAIVNPVLLRRAIAPHVAAAEECVALDVADIVTRCEPAFAAAADFMVVEGAGGWLVPLNERETMADLCVALDAPVVLVVGMRLGCLNHALLTAAAIRAAGLPLAGWVANACAPGMDAFEANLATLRERLPAPLLGVVPHLAAADDASAYLDIGPLGDD